MTARPRRCREPRDDEYLSHWLGEGYAVVASDYAGLGTPGLMSYLNSVTTARGGASSSGLSREFVLSSEFFCSAD